MDDAALASFKQFLTSENIPWTEKDVNDNLDWLKINIKEAMFTSQFGELQGLRVHADWDPQIQKALSYLPEAQALEDNAHKVLAEKAQAHEAQATHQAPSSAQGVPIQP